MSRTHIGAIYKLRRKQARIERALAKARGMNATVQAPDLTTIGTTRQYAVKSRQYPGHVITVEVDVDRDHPPGEAEHIVDMIHLWCEANGLLQRLAQAAP